MTTSSSTSEIHGWLSATDAASLQAWVAVRLASYQSAIDALLAATGRRTVENTLRPFDDAANQLSLAANQSHLLYAVGATPELRDAAQAQAARIAAIATGLSLNPLVYNALAAIDAAEADATTRHILERTLLQYRLSGVDQDETTRNRLRALHDRATELSLAFGRNVQEDVRSVKVEAAALSGLPEDYIARHAPGEDGKITITTDQPDYAPVMRYAANDNLRRELFLAYNQRGYPANQQVLERLLTIRAEIASILGYKCWADLATADQMMRSSANMKRFLAGLDATSRPAADREYSELLAWVRTQRPGITQLDDSNAGFWGEKYRHANFDFDSQSVRPYFPYAAVQAGVLQTVSTLFGVEFAPAAEPPPWHKSVAVFEVRNAGHAETIGRIYLDMHPREGKDKWFSASPLVPGIVPGNLAPRRAPQVPEALLICNFSGGDAGDPGLLEYSDVVTLLHEFGHLMHYILGGQHPWTGAGGFSVEGDFIEVPSQMLEEFFRDPAILQSFAMHYQTGEPIPTELVRQMNRANAYGRGRWVQQQLFYTNFSLELHDENATALDLDATLRAVHDRFLSPKWIDGNRMYASFTHLTGYSSNYYTYLYDKVMAIDFFAQFERGNLLACDAATRYRNTVMAPGASKPAETLVRDFLGRDADMQTLQGWIAQGG